MPELPEVECLRQSLLHPQPSQPTGLIGQRVVSVRVLRRDVLTAPGDPPGGLSRTQTTRRAALPAPANITDQDLLVGQTIHQIERCGKQLAIWAVNPAGERSALLVRLGMTGQLLLNAHKPTSTAGLSHIHVEWLLTNTPALSIDTPHATTPTTTRLIFRDPRRFGGVQIARTERDVQSAWSELGPDALTITDHQLAEALSRSSRAIKAALLDQSVLAGVGNIYADEALWAARLSPRRMCRRLKLAEVATLAQAIRTVLNRAVLAGGSTLRDYVNGRGEAGTFQSNHAVYGRAGLPCPRCLQPLASAIIAQRTTVWCRACQSLPKQTPR